MIKPAVEEREQFLRAAGHLRREGDHRGQAADVVAALRGSALDRLAGVVDDVLDQAAEQRAQDIVAAAFGFEMRVGGERAFARVAPELEVAQLLLVDQARLEAVVEIVADVGDLVGEIDRLRLERRLDKALDQPVRRRRACAGPRALPRSG